MGLGWGDTPRQAVKTVLSKPAEVTSAIFGGPVTTRLKQMAFTPLADPIGMVASLPALAAQRLSNYEAQRDLHLYYGIGAWTVWLLALVRAVRGLARLSLWFALTLVALPLVYRPVAPTLHRVTSEDLDDDALLKETIPVGARVAAQTDLIPHLEVSTGVKLFPSADTDWVALRPRGFRWPLENEAYERAVTALRAEGFGIVKRGPSVFILKRGAPEGDWPALIAALK